MDLNEALEQLEKTSPILAKIFKRYWETPLKEFSALLWKKGSSATLENRFLNLLQDALKKAGASENDSKLTIEGFQKHPVLQTSHHITPTNGPGFLASDIIALTGLPESQNYIVGANSGVAFSNSAWSGALSYGSTPLNQLLNSDTATFKKAQKAAEERIEHGETENRISLIPAKLRDGLVFGNGVPESTFQVFKDISQEGLEKFAPLVPELLHSEWAASNCQKIQRSILDDQRIYYLDINLLLADYIADVLLNDPDHPVYQVFFNQEILDQVQDEFEHPVFFLGSRKGKKSWKVENIYWNGNNLINFKTDEKITPKVLADLLKQRALCPGVFLLFLVLRFVNGIHCLGSFRQIEYMESYRNKWKNLKLPFTLYLEEDEAMALTTGRILVSGKEIYPLDIAIKGKSLNFDEFQEKPMGTFWKPVLRKLL